MKQKKFLIIFAVFAVLILAGFSCGKKEAAPANVSTAKIEEKAKEEVINPLKLEYTLKNAGPGGEGAITYFLESKKKCGDREAYLGLAKVDMQGQSQYAKVTIYADNGEMATSRWNNEEAMAFDDSVSISNDMNIPLAINDIFNAAGKNFNSPEYWQINVPTVLKDVVSGRSKGNYSVIPQGEDNTAIVPCTKFKIVAKTTTMDGYFNACVASKINNISLSFIVSMAFQNNQGPSWQLKSFTSEKSGLAWIPQCLEPVKCAFIPQPEQAERSACEAGGKARIETETDDKGCVIKYKCMAELDQVKDALNRTQRPGCSINQTVLNKYFACRKNNQPNFEPTKYDEGGCLLDINCRQ
jgi:hypothetical protein